MKKVEVEFNVETYCRRCGEQLTIRSHQQTESALKLIAEPCQKCLDDALMP